ncbi:MAG TPA: TIGR03118 family protein [Pirellulales bacterium]|nr:TIGR03118 family protein [Pirellulales bacterium]
MRPWDLERLEQRRLLSFNYLQFALASDQSAALLQDANLVNPWGIGLNSTSGNFWVADNGTGVVTQYGGDVNSQPLTASSLVVTVPGGSPTAAMPNTSSGAFTVSSGADSGPSTFLLGSKSGQISGWNANVPSPNPSLNAQTGTSVSGAVFTGMTLAQGGGQPLLYATDFRNGAVDAFDANFQPVTLTGSFTDPTLPSGLSPFNIQLIYGRLYVTYAVPDASGQNAVPGAGNGRVDIFDTDGNFLQTLVHGNSLDAPSLNAPWGLALAPNNFGNLNNTLLVANSGNGQIYGFNPFNGMYVGTVSDANGNPMFIDGVHGLSFGNGVSSGAPGMLYFTAGPNNQSHGLFGALESIDGMPIDSVGGSFSAVAGTLYSGLTATFGSVNLGAPPSSYLTTIAWGDGGSSNGVLIPLGGGRFNVGGSHTYSAIGTYQVTVNISDGQGHSTSTKSVIQVSGGAISLASPGFSATEGAAFSGAVAAFTDGDGNANPGLYATTINWGDGTLANGTVSYNGAGFNVSGAHTYAEEGPYNVTVTVHDSDGASATSSASVTVADAPLTILGGDLNLTEGTLFSGAVATFTDANPNGSLGDYSATIRWGDGATTTGTVSADVSGFQISGEHTYADEGNFTAYVIVRDVGGASATATLAASIAEGDFFSGNLTLISPTEGATFSSTVAVINDTNAYATAADFSATIDWGDGTTAAGTITGSGGLFSISGSHAYADEGAFVMHVTMVDDSPGTASITLTGNVTVAEGDTLSTQPFSLTTTEGATFSGAVATFSNTNPMAQAGGFSAVIDWGDGTVDAGTVSGGGTSLTVSGTHQYADEGSFTAHVVLGDDAPGTAIATANVDVTVADAPLSTTGTNLSLTEGATFAGTVASLLDANPLATPADYTVTLDWGDGATTSGSVVSNGFGGFNVQGVHAYAEGGSYLIGVFVHDAGGASSSVITAATVADWPITGAPVTVTGTEGTLFSGAVATFHDADPDGGSPGQYTVNINWGDGVTSGGTVTGGAGDYTVSGTHTFADEATAVVVTISDAGGSSATVNSPADIADADVLAGVGLTAGGTEGQTFSGQLATFSDAYTGALADDFSLSIDWGDGATTGGSISGSAGAFTVSGSHAYADEGSYTATIVMSDDAPGTASATATSTINVVDAPLTPHGITIHPTEHSTFSGVVGSFTDGNPGAAVSNFTATIDWGDGATTSGTVVATAGGFNVVGSHSFGEEGMSQAVQITIHDVGGSSTTIASTADVADAPISITAVAVHGLEAATLANIAVATFTDPGGPDPLGDYSAEINWGDGSSSAGTISLDGGVFTVSGTHVYGDEGSFNVSVAVNEAGGAEASVQSTATILEELLSTGDRGTPTQRWVNEFYHDLLGRQAEPGALTYWAAQADAGANRQQIIARVINSTEYRLDQTQALYEKYLHRSADPGAQTFGAAYLLTHTVEQLADVLLGSHEYFEVRGGGANDGFLDALYADTLHRAVDSGARTYFDGLLAHGTATGKIAAAILSSTEYLDQVVQGIYQQLLERSVDPGGQDYWVGQLQHGVRDEVIGAGIAASDEYFAKTAP